MHAFSPAVSAFVVALALAAAIPGCIYAIGIARVHGRPVAADPAHVPREAAVAAWQRCGERVPVTVRAIDPWSFTAKHLFGGRSWVSPGERAVWRIARAHNAAHPVGNAFWWHVSGAALNIWITRHWTAEQIGATLVRDCLCG